MRDEFKMDDIIIHLFDDHVMEWKENDVPRWTLDRVLQWAAKAERRIAAASSDAQKIQQSRKEMANEPKNEKAEQASTQEEAAVPVRQ